MALTKVKGYLSSIPNITDSGTSNALTINSSNHVTGTVNLIAPYINATTIATGYQLNGTTVLNYSGGNVIVGDLGAGVILEYGASTKLTTTNTGINVTGTVQADNLTMLDSEYIRLGNSNDLQIFHDGNHSMIQDLVGTGALKIKSNDTRLEDADGNNIIKATSTAAELYFSGSKKLETTSAGGAFTGIWTGNTVTQGTSSNNTAFASTEYVTTAINALIGGAPATLDTLNEIAASINDDANYVGTVNNLIAAKAPLASPAFTGKVGIGITPVEILDIKSSSGDARIRLDAPASSDTEIKFYNAGVAQYTIGHDDATDNFVIGGANVDAPMVSIDKSGNVGIGTTSPDEKLDITGGYLKFNGGDYGIKGSAGLTYYATSEHYFYTGGSERMRIDSSGRVGIGRTPSISNSKLEVGGADNVSLINVEASGVTGGMGIGSTGLQFFHGSSSKMRIFSDGDVSIGMTANYAKLNVNGDVRAENSRFLAGREDAANPAFAFHDDADTGMFNIASNILLFATGGTERIRITSAGNVGIGTTTPTRPLQIQLTEGAAGDFQTNLDIKRYWTSGSSTDRYTGFTISDYNSISAGIYANRTASHANYGSDLNFYTNSGSSNLDPSVSLTKRMTILANGYVGIGTPSPLDALHIVSAVSTDHRGNLLLSDSTAVATGVGGQLNFGGKFSGSTLTEWAGIQGTKENATDGQYGGQLEFKTRPHNGALATKMTIDSAGKVGIGTTSPASALSGSNVNLTMEDADGADIRFKRTSGVDFTVGVTSSNTAYVWNGSSHHMLFGTAGTERMRIDSAGRVSFGPDASDILIDPASTNSGNNLIYMRGNASGDKSSIQMNHYGSADYYIGVGHVAAGKFNIANELTGNDFVIDTTGNVGIGTSSPSRQLEIFKAGEGGAYRIKVKGDTGHTGIEIENTASSNTNLLFRNPSYTQELYMDAVGKFHVYNNSLHRFTVDQAGNVGIGATAPRATLDVRGGHSSSVNEAISFGRTDDNYRYNSIFSYNTSSTNSYLSFKIHNGGSSVAQTETMVIGPGKVGIGTTDPAQPLHVKGVRPLRLERAGVGAFEISIDNTITGDSLDYVIEPVSGSNSAGFQVRTRNTAGTLIEALNINHDGSILVGKSTDAFGTAGAALRGVVSDFVRAGGPAINVNRLTSDGDMIILHKDGTNVGSLASVAGAYLAVRSTGGNLRLGANSTDYWSIDEYRIYPTTDAVDDIGLANYRVKDLYLSGKISTGTTSGLSITADSNNRGQLNLGTSQAYQLIGGTYYGYTGYKTGGYHRWFGSDGSEDMRVASSGSLLVGRITENSTASGHRFTGSGFAAHIVANDYPLLLNRLSSDGPLLTFRKDSSDVGAVDSYGGLIQFGQGNVNLKFSNAADAITPANDSGSHNDDDLDLGSSVARFKDLYLSGGVYLGGTGSANKLDDYEEGTWTPDLKNNVGSSVTHSVQAGFYTKIGNLVTVSGTIQWSANGSNANGGYTVIAGLPYAADGTTNGRNAGNVGAVIGFTGGEDLSLIIDPGNSFIYIIRQSGTTYSHTNAIAASGAIYGFEVTYRV